MRHIMIVIAKCAPIPIIAEMIQRVQTFLRKYYSYYVRAGNTHSYNPP